MAARLTLGQPLSLISLEHIRLRCIMVAPSQNCKLCDGANLKHYLAMIEATTTVVPARNQIKLTAAEEVRFWAKVNKDGPTMPHMDTPCWVWTACKFKYGYGQFSARRQTLHAHRVAWMLANGPIPHDGSTHGICVCHRCDRRDCCRVDHLFLGTNADNVRDMASKGRQARGDKHGSRTKPERLSRGDNHYARLRPEVLARGDKHGSRLHPEKLARGDRHGSRLHPESRPRGDNHPNRLRPERMVRGEANAAAKLTEEKVIEIRALHAAGYTQSSLAEMFSVSFSTICRTVNLKTWKHLA